MRSNMTLITLLGLLVLTVVNAQSNFHDIFFFGNSYTARNTLALRVNRYYGQRFSDLPQGDRPSIRTPRHSPGGATLANHFLFMNGDDNAPNFNTNNWGFVVMQDQSVAPTIPAWEFSNLFYVDRLVAYPRDNNIPVCFFSTWGHRGGYSGNGVSFTYEEMTDALFSAYQRYAEVSSREGYQPYIAPCGLVFKRLWQDCLDEGIEPRSDDCLWNGLYENDGSHPSGLGTVVCGMTIGVTMSGISPFELNYNPQGQSTHNGFLIRDLFRSAVSRTIIETFNSGAIKYPFDQLWEHQQITPVTDTPAPVTPSPSSSPSRMPSPVPNASPSRMPSRMPSAMPTAAPTSPMPSKTPTIMPSETPSILPSASPTKSPTTSPSASPSLSAMPSQSPSDLPSQPPSLSAMPSKSPTDMPSQPPSLSVMPSDCPSAMPSDQPSGSSMPSDSPSHRPSDFPSVSPSHRPSSLPSHMPSEPPTSSVMPSDAPSLSQMPSVSPSNMPSDLPSLRPTSRPSDSPSHLPSQPPSLSSMPSDSPSAMPTPKPSTCPTQSPTMSIMPSMAPSLSAMPSQSPSQMPSGSNPDGGFNNDTSEQPSQRPSSMPVVPAPSEFRADTEEPSSIPTVSAPTPKPTPDPTLQPTSSPSASPSMANPTASPSSSPAASPSASPSMMSPSSNPSSGPTPDAPSTAPSSAPTPDAPSTSPSSAPTPGAPSFSPSDLPTASTPSPTMTPTTDIPSAGPTGTPTRSPTMIPTTDTPSRSPTMSPTTDTPSGSPTMSPTTDTPSSSPTMSPTTDTPSRSPTMSPTTDTPSAGPTTSPTGNPTLTPSKIPTQSPSAPPSVSTRPSFEIIFFRNLKKKNKKHGKRKQHRNKKNHKGEKNHKGQQGHQNSTPQEPELEPQEATHYSAAFVDPHFASPTGKHTTTFMLGSDIIGEKYLSSQLQQCYDQADPSQPIEVSQDFAPDTGLGLHYFNTYETANKAPSSYDWVILQELPRLEMKSEYQKSFSSGGFMEDLIVQLGGTDTMFLMSWGYRDGIKDANGRQLGFLEHNSMMLASNIQLVKNADAEGDTVYVAPVGLAFLFLYLDCVQMKINPLSGQCIFSQLYAEDGINPSPIGSYLTALTLTTAMTGEDPDGLECAPDGMDSFAAFLIKDAARKAVLHSIKEHMFEYTWNTTAWEVNEMDD